MARHKQYEAADSPDPALDISSLIDVTFLLLIYFLVSASIQPRETDLLLQLPSPMGEGSQPEIAPLFIKIDAADAVYVGTGPTEQVMDTDASVRGLPFLSSWLEIYAAAARSALNRPLVQLWVADGASQQRVVDVLNALATKEIHAVAFTDLGT